MASNHNQLSSQSRSIALQIMDFTCDPAQIFWASEVYSDSVVYETNAKVFTFEDGSRIRVTPDHAELLS